MNPLTLDLTPTELIYKAGDLKKEKEKKAIQLTQLEEEADYVDKQIEGQRMLLNEATGLNLKDWQFIQLLALLTDPLEKKIKALEEKVAKQEVENEKVDIRLIKLEHPGATVIKSSGNGHPRGTIIQYPSSTLSL